MSLASTVSGLAEISTDLNAQGFATVAGVETLTNKTLTSPVINTATFGGINVLTGTISGGTVSGVTLLGSTFSGGSFVGTITNAATISGGTISGILYALDPVVVAPSNGDTVTLSAGQTSVAVNPAGTIAAATILFPPSPVVGQPLGLGFTQIITTLTLSGGVGVPVVGGLVAAVVGGGGLYRYKSAAVGWIRCAL